MREKEPLRLMKKCYDSIEYGYLYGFNQKLSGEAFAKVQPYMKKFLRGDYKDPLKITGQAIGWMCTRENVPKIEEILGITDTVEKRENEYAKKLADPIKKQEMKEKAQIILDTAFAQGDKPTHELSRLMLHSSLIFDLNDSYKNGKEEGKGTLYIYTPRSIYYVMNNGVGKNSSNNITTSNGGAIGYRLFYHERLDQLVRLVTDENEYKED